MEDKKAKFIIYMAIALIAFVCSSVVVSMTGDLSDWIVASMNTNEDQNNNGYVDSSENGGFFSFNSNDDGYNSEDDTYSSDGYDDSGEPNIFEKIQNKLFNSNSEDSYSSSDYYSESSSNDNPDLLARFLRMFMSDG